ncbi:MAG: hypothetical protein KDJ41_07145 [Hyphomicrobiaceae bacterium]|nr:hypothetical protein [Hyphomicrobiaceae bacterium]
MSTMATDASTTVLARMCELPAMVNGDDALVRRGRFLDCDFLVGVGDVPVYVSVRGGRIAALEQGERLTRRTDFAIRAAPETWLRFWEAVPAPGWHDLSALVKQGAASMEGDFRVIMANLQYFKDVLARPRARAAG